jgi:uncharacterized membrane protein|tara:strand:+ start:694 stop:876 length:183 start_codon:yes stop_codon:yes gene_type:complete
MMCIPLNNIAFWLAFTLVIGGSAVIAFILKDAYNKMQKKEEVERKVEEIYYEVIDIDEYA